MANKKTNINGPLSNKRKQRKLNISIEGRCEKNGK